MPVNFNASLETNAAPNITFERPVSDYSDNVVTAGKALTNLFSGLGKDKDEQYLGEFSAALSEIESGTTQYAARLQELYMQTEGADAAKMAEIESQIKRIKSGEEQGRYNPTQARLQIDNLVKQYSSQHPLLAKDIRTMSQAAKGNLSQIVNDALGLDPYLKSVVERYETARKEGKSPDAFQRQLDAETAVDNATKTAQAEVAIGNVTKVKVIKGATRYLSAKAEQAYDQFVYAFEKDIKNGTVPGVDQITGAIANLEQGMANDMYSFVAGEYGKDDTGTWSLGTDDYNIILAPVKGAMENLKTFLTGSAHTPEQKLKLLKQANELYSETAVADLWGNNAALGAFIARAKMVSPDFATSMISGKIAFDSQIRQATGAGESVQKAEARLRNQADAFMNAGKVPEAASILFALDNKDSGLSSQAVMGFLLGTDYKTGNPTFDARTVAQGITTFINEPKPEIRNQMAGGILENVSWSRLVKTPELANHVSKDPSLHPTALAKATSHVLSTLSQSGSSLDAVTFDPLRGVNAFNYKQPVSISSSRTEAILELNRTYQNILRLFGADVAGEWVNALIQPDTQHGLSKDGNFGVPSKKKVDEVVAMGDTMKHVMDANRETYNLPEELVMALGFRESTLGRNLTSSTSSAAGPLAIIDDTFNTINTRYFEGKLDPNNMYHRGEAALANLAEIYQRNNGDVTKTLLEHFSGKPDGWSVVDKNGTSGVQFVTEVFEKMKEYQKRG